MKTKAPTLSQRIRERIRRRNASFARMSDINKRKELAREVLTLIEIGKIKPAHEGYIRLTNTVANVEGEGKVADLQDFLAAKGDALVCRCCALGGALCALASIQNRVPVVKNDWGNIVDFSKHKPRLIKIFGSHQVALIEYYFEGWNQFSGHCYESQPTRRLKYIFTKILEHPQGIFDPYQ